MFALSGVSKHFDGTPVLEGLDLRIESGRTTVLIGPSGCGKSTILRLMIGLLEADAGTVQFGSAAVSRSNALELRVQMGYVIQDGGLFPHLRADQNAALMARHLGWEEERIRSRISELARLTHLPEDALERYPAQLSGGQRQRVSLMRALMLDPEVLLLDEPLGALDPMIRADLQTDLRDVFRSLGKTVVTVTHDMGEAAYLGDTIVLLRRGHVVQQGPVEDLLDRPAEPFVTQFINAQRSPLDAARDGAA